MSTATDARARPAHAPAHGTPARRDPARHPRGAGNDKMRRLLRHPHAGGFRAEGGADWPNDRFTKRRLADGSIKREERPPSDKDKRGHQHRSSSGDAA